MCVARNRKQWPATVAAVLLCLYGVACGGKSQNRPVRTEAVVPGAFPHSLRSASGEHATPKPAPPPLKVEPGQHYLNDGDNDPSNDYDRDDWEKGLPDDDNDIKEDTQHPENDKYQDKDDNPAAYGPLADTIDRRAVAALAKRYYAAAVAEDGAKACAMINPTLANSVVEDYGRPPGPAYLRGNTCAQVMTRLFSHSHAELTTDFVVTEVRVNGNHAYAFLGSKKMPASTFQAIRRRGTWKSVGLIGTPLS